MAVMVVFTLLSTVVGTDSASAAKKRVKRKAPVRTTVTNPSTASPVPADFNMQFVQDSQSVTAGDTAQFTFDVTSSATFVGAIVFDLPNLTDKFTGRVIPESATRVRLEINVPPFANTNSGVFVLRGRSGDFTRQAMFRLNVTARPVPTTTTTTPPPTPSSTAPSIPAQFTLKPNDISRSAAPGEQQQYNVSIDRSGGFAGSVDLRVDGLPTGTTASFSPNPTTAGTVLYVTPSATTPSGTYLLIIVGQAGTTTRAAAVQLVVRRTGDFTLGLAPNSVTVPAGNDVVSAVNVVPRPVTSPVAPVVAFSAAGLPAGAVVVFDPNPSNGLTTVRVRTAPSTPVGTYKVTINGTSATFSHSIVLTVVIDKSTVGGFGITANPISATVAPGADTTYTLAIIPSGGFSSAITFVVRNLPPFAIFSVASQTATTATIKVSTGLTTPTGTFPLQITGTAGALAATVEVALVVS